ncbi:uncharacterized protein LOC135397586 [Ornithodoros turicata]|uniref:uncharacterized protein LOC135397586 n=1 Tax=Ornithodoros turicata TaxID=34597 RepID=UPI00313A0223
MNGQLGESSKHLRSSKTKKATKKKPQLQKNVRKASTTKIPTETTDQNATTREDRLSHNDGSTSFHPPGPFSDHEKKEPSSQHITAAVSPGTLPRKRRDSLFHTRRFIQRKRGAVVEAKLVHEPLPDLSHTQLFTEGMLFGPASTGTLWCPSDPPGVSRPGNRRHSSVRFGQATYREYEATYEDDISKTPKNITNIISFLVIGGALLLLLSYLLSMLKPASPRSKAAQHCVSKACHDSTAYLDNVTDARIDPCRDFFGYVCSAWANQDADKNVGFLQDVRLAVLKKVNQTLVETGTVPPDRHGTHIFYSFYKSCYDFMTSRSAVSELPHATFERHFGSLRHFLEKPYSSVLITLIRLSLKHGVDSVFGVSMVESTVHPELLISRTRSVQHKLSADRDPRMEGYLLDALQNISAASFPVKEYHRKLMSLDDAIQSVFASDEGAVRETQFRDVELLVKEVTAETWLRTVNDVLPPGQKLGPESRIKTRGFNATRQVFCLLDDSSKEQDDKLKMVYLYLQLLAEVLYLDYRRHFVKSDTIRTCLETSQKVLTHTWSLLFSSASEANNITSTIDTMYASISQSVVDPDYLTWMDSETQLLAKSAVKNIKLIGLPARSSTGIDTNYAALTLNGSVIENYIALLRNEQAILHRFPPTAEHALLNKLQLDGTLSYYEPLSSVIVPAAYRIPPILYTNAGEPQYFDFPTLGVLMAREISRVIGPSVGFPWWSAYTKSHFNRSLQCLVKMHERMASPPYMDKMSLAEGIFAWSRSLRIVYDVLRSRSRELKSSTWETTEAQRVFFRRFCLLSCKSDPRPQPLTPRQQCMLPVQNMPEFLEAFRCAQGQGASVHVCKIP